MDRYKEWGSRSLYDSITTLYDRHGAVFVNIWETCFRPYDSIKTDYSARNSPDSIRYFSWTSPYLIDIITPETATVPTTYKLLLKSRPDTFAFNYSAVLTHNGNEWKLRQESELPKLQTAHRIYEWLQANMASENK